ncbi:DUF4136 domain-containing protein [Congregibacter sp.]|jgi:hypothetical protein|uniref:DUF4136 domain-containing protein n=1 Tax=Congregibacter sp. TaxID=2744308 RepID=UPI0039E3B1F4
MTIALGSVGSVGSRHRYFYPRSLLLLIASILLGACSGVEVLPEDTQAFVATGYSSYAWRSEPPSQTDRGRDRLPQSSAAIRTGFEARMTELGYRRVDKADAEFLVEYMASTGYNDGQMAHVSSNTVLYPSSVNRQIDGASVDNAYALGGAVETGVFMLVFVDPKTTDVLWRVQISMVVEDSNSVDAGAVGKAIRQGLSTMPPAS